MKGLLIKPFDTLFFRDGKPFGMGEESFADIIFPPFPTTFYGALRSKIISENGGLKVFFSESNSALKEVAGTPKYKGKLRIIGPILRKNTHYIFPSPADLFEYKKKDREKELIKLSWEEVDLFHWKGNKKMNIKYFVLNRGNETLEGAKDTYISHEDLKLYLSGNKDVFNNIKIEEIYKKEHKTGILLKNKNIEEGYLYRLPMIRLKEDTDFYLFYDGVDELNFSDNGVLQLGGEGRACYYEKKELVYPGLSLGEFKETFKGDKAIKLYLLTPAFVQEDGLPYLGNLERLGLKLVGYAVNGTLNIGGWDINKGYPKTMRLAWRPGSVLLFESSKDIKPDELYKEINFKPVLTPGEESEGIDDEKEGYGVVLLGVENVKKLNRMEEILKIN